MHRVNKTTNRNYTTSRVAKIGKTVPEQEACMAPSVTPGPINYEEALSILKSLVNTANATPSAAPSPIPPGTDSSAQDLQPVEAPLRAIRV